MQIESSNLSLLYLTRPYNKFMVNCLQQSIVFNDFSPISSCLKNKVSI